MEDGLLKTRRMKVSLLCGVAVGVVCIIGALVRSGGTGDVPFLFALWFNRLLMRMVIGSIHEKAALAGIAQKRRLPFP